LTWEGSPMEQTVATSIDPKIAASLWVTFICRSMLALVLRFQARLDVARAFATTLFTKIIDSSCCR
jgi:hypothetical protein